MIVLLLACADESGQVATRLDPDIADVLLAAEPTEVAEALTALSGDAPAGRLRLDGPAFGGSDARGFRERVAVVDVNGALRVVLSTEGVRLLAWVEPDGLVNVLPTTMWLDATGHAVDGLAAGVRVPAGTAVYDGEASLDLFGDDSVAVAPELTDALWFPDDQREARALVTPLGRAEDTVGLVGGTVLRDDDGRELVRLFESECVVELGEVLARDGAGRVLVLVALGFADDILVRGWVEEPPESEELGCFSGLSRSHSSCGLFGAWLGAPDQQVNPVPLPAGALLYDAPDGSVVGVTERLVRLDRGPEDGAMPGWEAVLAPSPWGADQVWVRAANSDESDELEVDWSDDIEVRAEDRGAFQEEEAG